MEDSRVRVVTDKEVNLELLAVEIGDDRLSAGVDEEGRTVVVVAVEDCGITQEQLETAVANHTPVQEGEEEPTLDTIADGTAPLDSKAIRVLARELRDQKKGRK